MRERIGILGGSFNPVHLGHLVLAQDALEKGELDQIILMPCALPPHKDARDLVDGRLRLEMLQHAIEGDPSLTVSDIEIKRGGVSYSIDTLHELKEIYPTADLRFIIGSDMLAELHTWKEIYSIVEQAGFIVFRRPDYCHDALPETLCRLKSPWPQRLQESVISGHMIEISSSEIRMRIAEGMCIRYLVHPAVEMYINEHGLYRS